MAYCMKKIFKGFEPTIADLLRVMVENKMTPNECRMTTSMTDQCVVVLVHDKEAQAKMGGLEAMKEFKDHEDLFE